MTYRTFGGTPDVVATDASGNVTAAPVLKVYTTRTGSTQPPLLDTGGTPITTVSPISSGSDTGLIEFQADADGMDYLWLDRQDGSRRMRVSLRDPVVTQQWLNDNFGQNRTIRLDTDGVPYFDLVTVGTYTVRTDTDGVPYFI